MHTLASDSRHRTCNNLSVSWARSQAQLEIAVCCKRSFTVDLQDPRMLSVFCGRSRRETVCLNCINHWPILSFQNSYSKRQEGNGYLLDDERRQSKGISEVILFLSGQAFEDTMINTGSSSRAPMWRVPSLRCTFEIFSKLFSCG
jgi:hypothetical protein